MSRREVTGYQWSAPTASAGQSAKRVKRGAPFLAAFARSGAFDSTPENNHVETAARLSIFLEWGRALSPVQSSTARLAFRIQLSQSAAPTVPTHGTNRAEPTPGNIPRLLTLCLKLPSNCSTEANRRRRSAHHASNCFSLCRPRAAHPRPVRHLRRAKCHLRSHRSRMGHLHLDRWQRRPGREVVAVERIYRSTGLRATFSFRQFQSGFTGHSPHGDACPLLLFPARSDGIREGQVLQRSIYGVVSQRQPHRAGSPVFSGSEGALRTAHPRQHCVGFRHRVPEPRREFPARSSRKTVLRCTRNFRCASSREDGNG